MILICDLTPLRNVAQFGHHQHHGEVEVDLNFEVHLDFAVVLVVAFSAWRLHPQNFPVRDKKIATDWNGSDASQREKQVPRASSMRKTSVCRGDLTSRAVCVRIVAACDARVEKWAGVRIFFGRRGAKVC